MYTCLLENSEVKARPLDVYIFLVVFGGGGVNQITICMIVNLVLYYGLKREMCKQ